MIKKQNKQNRILKDDKDIRNMPLSILILVTYLLISAISIVYLGINGTDGKKENVSFLSCPTFAIAMQVHDNIKNEAELAKLSAEKNEAQNEAINANIEQESENNTLEDENVENEPKTDEDSLITDDIEIMDSTQDAKNGNKLNQELTNEPVGVTSYETYNPQEIESYFYSDAGKIALTTEYPYEEVDDSYFEDAAFIGDSRTLGIYDYAELPADFYCDSGLMIFDVFNKPIPDQRLKQKVDLLSVFSEKKYAKIYIMLGMNELGYPTDSYRKTYSEVMDKLKELQPDAIIYVMGCLHVAREKDDEYYFNNININDKNVAASEFADGQSVFYLDANPLFTDEEGYLIDELTFDGVHFYAQHYKEWGDYLRSHAVVR